MKKIIGLLASLKTAIFLIMLLTLLAITGTLIPQRLEAINYIQAFPKGWQFILGMGFDDMYRSALFVGTLALLSISAVLCVFNRWKSISKKLFGRFKNATMPEILAFEASQNLEKAPSDENLKGFEIGRFEDGPKVAFRCSGKAALLGGLILHIGLVLVFFGGLLGLLFGVEMSIAGKAGEKIPIPTLDVIRSAVKADSMSRQARHIRQFNPNDSRLETMREKIEELHKVYNNGIMHPEFKVAFDKLWIEHYNDENGNPQKVKSWNAEVRFMDVASGTLFNAMSETAPMKIQVNYPVSYKDYGFYLSSWNKNWKNLKMLVEYVPDVKGWEDYKPAEGSFPQNIEVGINEAFTIKDFPYSIVVNSFLPDLKITEGGFFNASQELLNPAAMIVAFDSNANCEVGHTWGFSQDKSEIAAHVSNLPLKFTFQSADSEYEAILQVAYDPGKPLVWLGCILFCLGMMLSFYVSYREEWIVFKEDGTATIALNSNRPASLLKKELPDFENRLTTVQKED